MRCGLVAFSFIQAGHEQCAQRLVVLGCEYGGMEGDDIGVGDELGANDGMRACRRGANLRSISKDIIVLQKFNHQLCI